MYCDRRRIYSNGHNKTDPNRLERSRLESCLSLTCVCVSVCVRRGLLTISVASSGQVIPTGKKRRKKRVSMLSFSKCSEEQTDLESSLKLSKLITIKVGKLSRFSHHAKV